MILGTRQILNRLSHGEIFRDGTWVLESVKEASYALRVADDGMIVGDNIIEPGAKNALPEIEIQPGRIAVLSTIERLCMPPDLVGRLGVRLEFASKGLVGQMGIQVDPYYGCGEDENVRLYIKVANLGNRNVVIEPGARVFNIEFSEVAGAEQQGEKDDTWNRLMRTVGDPSHQDWTYLTQINENLDTKADEINEVVAEKTKELSDDLTMRLGWIRDNQQAVVMFGVFLVAVTILAAMVGAILDADGAPPLVTDFGWGVLLFLCGVATVAIVVFLLLIGVVLWRTSVRRKGNT